MHNAGLLRMEFNGVSIVKIIAQYDPSRLACFFILQHRAPRAALTFIRTLTDCADGITHNLITE